MKKIPIIDDDPSVRNAFILTLDGMNLTIDQAENGKGGSEMVLPRHYEIVFMDLKMPEMNGVEALKKIRETDQKTPVNIITAFAGEFLQELEEAAKRNDSFQILEKPLTNEQLRRDINATVLKSKETSEKPGYEIDGMVRLSLFVFEKTKETLETVERLQNFIKKSECDVKFDIIDLSTSFEQVSEDIFATPTLVRKVPPLLIKIIGDLSDDEEIVSIITCKKNEI